MKEITVCGNNGDFTFIGEQIGYADSKFDKERNSEYYTKFTIYLTNSGKLVFTIRCNTQPEDKGRFFVCENLNKLMTCIVHPEYGTLSYSGQRALNEAKFNYKRITGRELVEVVEDIEQDVNYDDNFDDDDD